MEKAKGDVPPSFEKAMDDVDADLGHQEDHNDTSISMSDP